MNKRVTSPETDATLFAVAGLITLPIGVDILIWGQHREVAIAFLVASIVNFFNAWEARKHLPNYPPKRFTIRRFLLAATMLAVAFTIARILK